MGAAKCSAIGRYAAESLSSPNPSMRAWACGALAAVKDRSHLAQMSTMAKTDGAYRDEGLHKVFFVRIACLHSVGLLGGR